MGTYTSLTKTPQAGDDHYWLNEDFDSVVAFDVMSNDLGGKAKTLYSLADGTSTADLMDADAKAESMSTDYSANGAHIWIGTDGLVHYDAKTLDPSFRDALNALAEGETLDDTFTYAIRMGNGTLSWATVTITYNGTNDAPDITVEAGDSDGATLSEDDPTPLTASGTLTVVDPDTSDVVDLEVVDVQYAGNVQGSPDFAAMFSLTSTVDDLAANSGDVNNISWSFNAGSEDFNYLAVGESVVITYTIEAKDYSSDGSIARGGSDTQTVTITIEGENDGPKIVAGGDDGAALAEDGTVSANGSFDFTDVDLSDTHSVSVTPGNVGYLGSFNALVSDDSTGDGSGTVDWSFSVNNGDLQFLGLGDQLVQTYDVEVSDGNGGTAIQTVTITIDGENDDPELTGTAATLGDGTEDTAYMVSLADLLQGWTDVDQNTVLGVANLSVDHGSIVDNLDGTYTITPDANYNGPVVISYDVVDGDGGVIAASLGFNLAPVNDPAIVGGDLVGEVTEDGTENTGGVVTVSDVDGPGEESVTPAVIVGTYGTLTMAANGTWTYALNPGDPDLDTLDTGESDTDHFDLTTFDGTAFSIDITVNGADEPVIGITLPPTETGDGDPNNFDSATGTPGSLPNGNDVIVGGAGDDVFNGGNGADTIYGGAGNDTIHGDSQADTLYGQAGDDYVYGDDQADLIYGGSGADHLYGGNQIDNIYGGSGNDVIDGGAGNDIIIGGYGADMLTGGSDNDIFRYLSLLDTNDLITDFGNGTDIIDLSGIDAIAGGLDNAFTFGATTATANGVWYAQDGLNTIIYADTDGNTATAEFAITLQNYDSTLNPLVSTDFVL